MKHLLCLLFLIGLTASLQAQTLDEYATRLEKFGKSVPQEKVFVHMDNSSYFIGDTIWYKAYTMLSTGGPSKLSGLLYVELLNHDGYLVERENIKIENGQGRGCFVLTDSLYSGYYELRAYTRWQLNWGLYEHPHTTYAEDWFYSKQFAREFYRDYDKLYSRVFPVYDKPKQPGQFTQDMTYRPLLRYYKQDIERPEATVTFYPEGGSLIAGTRQRIAFEANDQQGKHLKGKLIVTNKNGQTLAEVPTESRGRGSFELDVTTNGDNDINDLKATFQWEEYSSKAHLPKAEREGVTLRLQTPQPPIGGEQNEGNAESDSLSPYRGLGGLPLTLQCVGTAASEELGVTVTVDGVLCHYQSLGTGDKLSADIPMDKLRTGIAQVTVFNAQGRIWADRLVFINKGDIAGQNITFDGLPTNAVQPFEAVSFDVKGPEGGTVSLAVRDATHSEYTFDGGNILTEMLLASQIKGFVEQPEYYFEKNDEEHQRALDLLLMVQGWRRYNWTEMSVPGAFSLVQPYERTPWIYGSVNRYEAEEQANQFSELSRAAMAEAGMDPDVDAMQYDYPEYDVKQMIKKWHGVEEARLVLKLLKYDLGNPKEEYSTSMTDPLDAQIEVRIFQEKGKEDDKKRKGNALQTNADMAATRFHQNQGSMKHEVTVHAEFATPGKASEGRENAVQGDMMTYNNGLFRIEAPSFYNYCYFFCTASNQEKWKNGKEPEWIAPAEIREDMYGNGEINYPEYYVRFDQPYPRFVKPYNYYQATMNLSPRRNGTRLTRVDDATLMNEVTIGARHRGQKAFDASKPAFVLDAYDAFNAACDAGLCAGYYIGSMRFISDVARTYIGDMNLYRAYELEGRYNTRNTTFNFSTGVLEKYNHLHNLDKVYIYTDYSPRREGDKIYEGDDQPRVIIDLRVSPDGSRYVTYRDRRALLWGYSVCEDYYHVDYSTQPLPSTKDYRRTLYWNPDLQLDSEGRAHVTLYNNSKKTELTISAEGVGQSGTLMTGLSYPEDRQ